MIDPFVVFFITLGVGHILLRVLAVIRTSEVDGRQATMSVLLWTAALTGSVYSLVALRDRMTSTLGDRLMYFFIPSLLFGVAVSYYFLNR